MESKPIERAAVIGAGVMGAAIAAHLANAGIRTLLLDRQPTEPSEDERARGWGVDDPRVATRIVRQGFDAAVRAKPAAFFDRRAVELVSLGTIDQDLDRLEEVDWVVEAVIEDLSIKQDVLVRIAPYLGLRTILTTNTSGLSIGQLSEALPAGVRPRFFATHFFNPPRYLELMEIVGGPESDPELIAGFRRFAEERLGKGVVVAKDTPNFIANRLGVFALLDAMYRMLDTGLTVADVDALTGPLIGRPKSATLRTADVVGLDTLSYVANGMADRLDDDPDQDRLRPPPLVRQLVEAG
ncbi:MAG: 3-hydroxyacyl-CoA dehydrogenase family protein, partial [Planctomycetes bacterium]|nr:3-hydroxyacyl-CoA dehydrogenase family protein [Planctomycetota bacterium]